MSDVTTCLEEMILKRCNDFKNAKTDAELNAAVQDVVRLTGVYNTRTKTVFDHEESEAKRKSEETLARERLAFEKMVKDLETKLAEERLKTDRERIRSEAQTAEDRIDFEQERLYSEEFRSVQDRKLKESEILLEQEKIRVEMNDSIRDNNTRRVQLFGDFVKGVAAIAAGVIVMGGVLDIEKEGRVTSKILGQAIGLIFK